MEERLAHMSEKDRAAESRSICRRLLPIIPKGSSVCAYYPLRTEVDLRPLMRELLERGDTVYLPCIEHGILAFRRAETLENLEPGELRIPEPPKNAEELDPQNLDFVLVPGRAFDRKGNRLGRGNGGYDKWIQKQRTVKNTRTIGIAFDCQFLYKIPMEQHDETVDAIALPRSIVEAENTTNS